MEGVTLLAGNGARRADRELVGGVRNSSEVDHGRVGAGHGAERHRGLGTRALVAGPGASHQVLVEAERAPTGEWASWLVARRHSRVRVEGSLVRGVLPGTQQPALWRRRRQAQQ